MNSELPQTHYSHRRIQMAIDRLDGMTYEQIGKKHGVKAARVSKIMAEMRLAIGAWYLHSLTIQKRSKKILRFAALAAEVAKEFNLI